MDDVEKNRRFNEELRERGLCLAVTRTWGNRALSTVSPEWRALRLEVLERHDWRCRFCGLRSKKWMVCDHLDGDASNNSIENLGINCPICDLVRHCGRAGAEGQLSIWISELQQVEIVQMTQTWFASTRRLPKPQMIDPKAVQAPLTAVHFANELLRRTYSELTEEELSYRGFFEPTSTVAFLKVL